MINWNCPKFGAEEKRLVSEVLEGGFVSEGKVTQALEKRLANILGVEHVIMTTSCTSALYLAIMADKNIRGYDEGYVAMPATTFIATKNAVVEAGLIPLIVDVDENFLIDRHEVEIQSKGKFVPIIIPVNLLGRDCKYPKGENTMICDNAACMQYVSNGKVGCYSLQSNKIVTCGQGGFCATDDDNYAKEIRRLKDFGRWDKDDVTGQGLNFKFNDIQAAIVMGQLERLDETLNTHIQQYLTYKNELDGVVKFPHFDLLDEIPLWFEIVCERRDELESFLKSRNIETRKPWTSLSQDCPNAVFYQDNVLWLPGGVSLSTKDQKEVTKLIKEFYGK
jgi:perosamine synthetase